MWYTRGKSYEGTRIFVTLNSYVKVNSRVVVGVCPAHVYPTGVGAHPPFEIGSIAEVVEARVRRPPALRVELRGAQEPPARRRRHPHRGKRRIWGVGRDGPTPAQLARAPFSPRGGRRPRPSLRRFLPEQGAHEPAPRGFHRAPRADDGRGRRSRLRVHGLWQASPASPSAPARPAEHVPEGEGGPPPGWVRWPTPRVVVSVHGRRGRPSPSRAALGPAA